MGTRVKKERRRRHARMRTYWANGDPRGAPTGSWSADRLGTYHLVGGGGFHCGRAQPPKGRLSTRGHEVPPEPLRCLRCDVEDMRRGNLDGSSPSRRQRKKR